MDSRRRTVVAAVVLLAWAATPTQLTAQASPRTVTAAAPAALDTLARARNITRWLVDGPLDSAWAYLSAGAREYYRTPDALRKEQRSLMEWGRETEVLDERFITRKSVVEYRRTVKVSATRKTMLATLQFDRNWMVVGWYHGVASEGPKP